VSLVPAACYSAAVSDTGEDPAGLPPEAAGVLDLLGLLAYASLTAFFRLSDDAALAIALSDKTALAEMAVAQFGHFQLLRARIEELDGDPGVVMQPFVPAVDAFHARTAPADWLEGLVKAYVGDGIASDFYRAVGQAQRVAAEREPLARMLAGQAASQLGDIGRMFAELTDAHAARMSALGLAD
jgi:tRNA-(MS[2]IO[6]A)-hydroxylase (MiaE)-like